MAISPNVNDKLAMMFMGYASVPAVPVCNPDGSTPSSPLYTLSALPTHHVSDSWDLALIAPTHFPNQPALAIGFP